MKILTTLLAFIWFLGWGFWFLNERGHIDLSSGALTDPVKDVQVDSIVSGIEKSDPPSFLTQHPPRSHIDFIIDSLMTIRQDNETIQVISYYDETEPYSGMNENIGIQRSINLIERARKKYAGRVLQPVGLIFREGTDTTGISHYYQVDKIDKTAPLRIINERRVLIFFPFASGNESAFSKITGTLDSLTNIWKTERKHLIITGYTDNSANTTTNYNLGLARAKSIQEYIVANGFPEERVTTLSRGEEDPISINTTVEGRFLNRRVEILVDK